MDFINELLPKLEHFRILGYWVVLLISFLESLVLVGGIVPGTTLVLFAGALAAQGYFDVGDLIWFASAGAILGDGLSFWLGGHGTGWFKEENTYLKPGYLETGKRFFAKHGAKSIILGRFIGPVRMLVPFVAGLSGMEPRRFYFWNIISAFAWGISHILAGYFLGQAWQVVEVWTSRGGILLAALVVVFLCLGLLRRFLIKQGKWLLALLHSGCESAWRKVTAHPRVIEFVERHPRLFSFIRARLDKTLFSGLPLTLLGIAFFYTLLLFGGVIEDVITSDRIVSVDAHLASLLSFYRGESLVRVFLWISALGTAWFIIVEGVIATAWLWIGKRREFIIPFWTTLAGSSAFCFLGKLAFQRQRPVDVAAVVETTFSFPSGHATVAVAFYGFLVYCLWRRVKSWTLRLNLLFGTVMLILAIGFSRLYLGVHYLSDVLGGYLLGLLWLIIGVSLVERRLFNKGGLPAIAAPPTHPRLTNAVLTCAGILCYVVIGFEYNPPRAIPETRPAIRIRGMDFAGGFDQYRLPRFTEAITGYRQEPLNLIVVARDDASLAKAFGNAGWRPADPATFGSAAKILKALVDGVKYPEAPIAPLFWDGRANDYGFEKPMSGSALHERQQVRIWNTDMITDFGERIFVGLACFDVGLKWWLVHELDPDLNAAREAAAGDLLQGNPEAESRLLEFVPPQTGKTVTNEKFFTNGILSVIHITSP